MIMLNTDAHNPNVKRKMTFDEFRNINRGIDQGADVPEPLLRQLYMGIQETAITSGVEASVVTFFNAAHEGALHKLASEGVKRWSARYFVLNSHCLYYFKSKEVCAWFLRVPCCSR